MPGPNPEPPKDLYARLGELADVRDSMTQDQFAARMQEIERNAMSRQRFKITPVDWSGPALHPTQVRAYALLAAANLTPPNSRPNADDLALWRANVIRTAREYERYIMQDPPKESEDSPQ